MIKLAFILFSIGLMTSSCQTTIKGQITNLDAEAIGGIEGKINLQGLDPSNRDVSEVLDLDQDGSFKTQSNIKSGNYLIEALIPGFHSQSLKLNIAESKKVELKVERMASSQSALIKLQGRANSEKGVGAVQLTPPEH